MTEPKKRMGRPPKFPQLHDKAWVQNHRTIPIADIASELGCSQLPVLKAFDRFGIVPVPQRPRESEPEPEIPPAAVQGDDALNDIVDPLEGLFYIADMLRDICRQLDEVSKALKTTNKHLSSLNADALKNDIDGIRKKLREGFS